MKPVKDVVEELKTLERQMKSLLENTETAILTMGAELQQRAPGSPDVLELDRQLSSLMTRITLGHTQALHQLAASVRELAEHMQAQHTPIIRTFAPARKWPPEEPKPPEDTWAPFEELPFNGLKCSDCGAPQRETPSGGLCENGHGGALGVP